MVRGSAKKGTREKKEAIIDLAAAVNRLADAVEKITEKGGKEISPLIPPTKKGSQKESFLSSACARACEKFLKPTVEEVAAYIREKGFPMECIAKKPRLWDTQIFFEKSFHPIKSRVRAIFMVILAGFSPDRIEKFFLNMCRRRFRDAQRNALQEVGLRHATIEKSRKYFATEPLKS